MRHAAPPANANIETIHPPRQTHSYWWSWLIRSEPVGTSKFVATNSTAKEIQRIGLTYFLIMLIFQEFIVIL
jgi:hypothetical protein